MAVTEQSNNGADKAAHPETTAVHGGRTPGIRAMAPVLWASTTFEIDTLADGQRMAHSSRATEFYSRHGNPTINAFEAAVAELEGADAARAFASGMGAITGVVLGLCSKGDHVVAQQQAYGGTTQLLAGVCPRFGIDVTFVDGTKPGAFADAVIPGRTMLVLAETPRTSSLIGGALILAAILLRALAPAKDPVPALGSGPT